MERFVIVMPVDTSAYLLPCDDGDTCKLETLQKLVGGPIEMAESICAEWEIPLEAPGEGERFQTFNPD